MIPRESNDFAIHIFHGHIYNFICNTDFILRVGLVWACAAVFPVRFIFLRVSLCGAVLTWGWSQGAGACTTCLPGSDVIGPRRSSLIQVLSWWADACEWIASFYSLALKHAWFRFINFINKCICVLAAFAQVKEVVTMHICCLFLSMCTLLLA